MVLNATNICILALDLGRRFWNQGYQSCKANRIAHKMAQFSKFLFAVQREYDVHEWRHVILAVLFDLRTLGRHILYSTSIIDTTVCHLGSLSRISLFFSMHQGVELHGRRLAAY
jgi:hypothetical protein